MDLSGAAIEKIMADETKEANMIHDDIMKTMILIKTIILMKLEENIERAL